MILASLDQGPLQEFPDKLEVEVWLKRASRILELLKLRTAPLQQKEPLAVHDPLMKRQKVTMALTRLPRNFIEVSAGSSRGLCYQNDLRVRTA